MENLVRVGILGFGTVGSGTYRMLEDNHAVITHKAGRAFRVTRIGVRDLEKTRSVAVDPRMMTTDLGSIVDDPEIDVVIELIGGIDPAAVLVERALRNGKHVVTANKELMAKHGSRLVSLARQRGLDLHYEAAVGGGIPLVQPLKHQLAGNDVLRMMGILNGTTNYILTRMADEGADFAEVLRDAQAEGYAEADPTNDVDGFDTMYKIAVLASIAFGQQVPLEGIYREGIRGVTREAMHYADRLGYRVRLLGIVEALPDERILARVHPTLIPKAHPLASVNGVYNALWLNGDFVGDLMFSGRGAGANPTASAVMGDLIDIGRNLVIQGSGSAIPYGEGGLATAPMDDLITRYCLRVQVMDRPRALGELATVLGNYGVSLGAMEMRSLPEGRGEMVFLTHPCRERDFQTAMVQVAELDFVTETYLPIRVEDGPGR